MLRLRHDPQPGRPARRVRLWPAVSRAVSHCARPGSEGGAARASLDDVAVSRVAAAGSWGVARDAGRGRNPAPRRAAPRGAARVSRPASERGREQPHRLVQGARTRGGGDAGPECGGAGVRGPHSGERWCRALGLRHPRRAPRSRVRPGEYAAETGAVDVSTLREPYRIEGKKTLGLELAEQLGWTLPDAVVYPTGGG